MSTVVIHPVGEESISLIQELTLQVWPQTYQHVLTPDQITYMLELMYSKTALLQQMQEEQQFVVAWAGQQAVGFASYGPTDTPYVYKLHKLYVVATVQKTGAGKALLGYIMDEVKKRSASHLILQVNRQNENAISFYKRMGFQVEASTDFNIGNDYYMKDYVMGIHL